MKKSIKIRIYPNKRQIHIINRTLGACRYIYNMFLGYNIRNYENDISYTTGKEFDKILNKLKKNEEEYMWIKEISSKAIKDTLEKANETYIKFFNKKGGFPKFRSKRRSNKESYFFIKDNVRYVRKHRINLPILGIVKILQDKDYPHNYEITGGRVIKEYDKYYIILNIVYEPKPLQLNDFSVGIDLGLKNYITLCSNNNDLPILTENHFKELPKYKKIDNKIKQLQQIISNKVEINYGKYLNRYLDNNPKENITDEIKNKLRKESHNSSRIRVLFRKIRILKNKLKNIRKDFIHKLSYMLTAKLKPLKITLEDLSVSNMIKYNGEKDKSLHKAIQESGFYLFKECIKYKCETYNITLRIADKFFSSSKSCSFCGNKKEDLSLSDRIYECNECGRSIDRDINAAYNLLHLKDKKCKIYS